ncbi:wax ester/triacylglycerol synthase domain-containing protein [Nonomuraea lactucae]|uniref:wax ester/triacylglycerol synthase domain-containing protein n=1 Tax=Nonomuraea lactucae TaxID=2249762 RepID=UPI001F06FF36|nr:wax ester/triacylglycerol synthase domain-containing protein [Nonomuraea lactucae]
MSQLTALDAQFLDFESATTTAHVAGLAILDPGGGSVNRRALAELLMERIHLSPALSLRLAPVPLGLDRPYWAADPEFDIDNHLFQTVLPAPGDQRRLADEVARIHARRLDRAHPLWEMHLINGLADGMVAVYTKVHHAAIDGVSGAETLATLLDLTPEAHQARTSRRTHSSLSTAPPSPGPERAEDPGSNLPQQAPPARLAVPRSDDAVAPPGVVADDAEGTATPSGGKQPPRNRTQAPKKGRGGRKPRKAPATTYAAAGPRTQVTALAPLPDGAGPLGGAAQERPARNGSGTRPAAATSRPRTGHPALRMAASTGSRPAPAPDLPTRSTPPNPVTDLPSRSTVPDPVTDVAPGATDPSPVTDLPALPVAASGDGPGLIGMLAGAAVRSVTHPVRAVGSAVRAAGDLDAIPLASTIPGAGLIAKAARLVTRDRQHRPELPRLAAPRTPLNGPISAGRRLSFGSVPLKDVRKVARANGVSVNDVVMTLCTAALRSWLAERDALPEEPLIVAVPVAVRTASAREKVGNQLSAMIAPVPTNVADPRERLREVGATMRAAKRRFALAPAGWLGDLCSLLPAPLTGLASPVIFRLASVAFPPINLIISNVPGPQFPLYLCGGRVLSYYPLSVVTDLTGGVNITCFSYDGMLDFGIVACPERMDDVWGLLDHLGEALDELLADEPAGAEPAHEEAAGAAAR